VLRPLLPVGLAAALLLAGCGGGGDDRNAQQTPALGSPGEQEAAAQSLGFPGFATKNTTRVGGADPVANAAAVAQAVFPARSPDTRPQAVALVDQADWRAGISAAQLAAQPIRAPVLLSQQGNLPQGTNDALRQLAPTGAGKAGGAQVIRVGAVARPGGFRATDLGGRDYAELARAIDRLHTVAAGDASKAVVVASAERPEFAMPAAGWAAKSGSPVLWVTRDQVPAATREAIADHSRPRIWVLGPKEVISDAVLEQLDELGTARRVGAPDPAANAVEFARLSSGWNVVDPGHGLVFASAGRPQDASAAAPLSAAGTYGPLLVLPDPAALPKPVENYLLDIQPGYDRDPVRGVYNHAWLMGDERAITIDVQSRIDALLEIKPVDQGG
jgi:hypothetical protein